MLADQPVVSAVARSYIATRDLPGAPTKTMPSTMSTDAPHFAPARLKLSYFVRVFVGTIVLTTPTPSTSLSRSAGIDDDASVEP